MFTDLGTFLEQAHNLSSLIIESSLSEYQVNHTFTRLCPIIPRRLKHLQLPINNLEQIKMIFERCENLSTIKFDAKLKFSKEIIQWFNDNTINSTCKSSKRTINVWIGKKNIQLINSRTDNKRIKLTDNSSDLELI